MSCIKAPVTTTAAVSLRPRLLTGHERVALVFPPERGREVIFPGANKVGKFWTPSIEQMNALEAGLRDALVVGAVSPKKIYQYQRIKTGRRQWLQYELNNILEDLPNYRVQYIGIIVRGKRRILASYFPGIEDDKPDRHSYWVDKWVAPYDGGSDYWRIQYDPLTGKYSHFQVNSSA